MNELVTKSQEGILEYAKQYVMDTGVIVSKNYDLPTAMASLYLNLIQVKDKNDKPVLETCSNESIKEAIVRCITDELNVGKKQGYFIPYGDKLEFQPSYFGEIKKAKSVAGVRIRGKVFREGELIDPEMRIDGTMIIKHKPSVKCLNNKILGAYAVATDINTGRVVDSDIMSREEIMKSAMKSKNGGKVTKEFEHEMFIRTVTKRLSKHFVNTSDDTSKVFVINPDGSEMQVNVYDDLVDVDYTINTDEQIVSEGSPFELSEENIITATDLSLGDTIPTTDIPEGAIEIPYREYKASKDAGNNEYELVPNTYNKEKRTCMVIKL